MGDPSSPQSDRDFKIEVPNFSGVLPAAGAFTDQAYTAIPSKARRLSVTAKYTTAAAASSGAAKYYVEWQIAQEPTAGKGFCETFIDSASPTIGPPDGEVPEYRIVVDGPAVPTAFSPFWYRLLSLEVPSCATGVRILAAESGDTAHPGTVEIGLAVSFVL